jgi:hypothetical protein
MAAGGGEDAQQDRHLALDGPSLRIALRAVASDLGGADVGKAREPEAGPKAARRCRSAALSAFCVVGAQLDHTRGPPRVGRGIEGQPRIARALATVPL